MKPPIIVSENGDISIYDTLEEAILGLEAIDVRNNEYEFFDSEGYRLIAVLISHDLFYLKRSVPLKQERAVLVDKLKKFLTLCGQTEMCDDLDALITQMAKLITWSREK